MMGQIVTLLVTLVSLAVFSLEFSDGRVVGRVPDESQESLSSELLAYSKP